MKLKAGLLLARRCRLLVRVSLLLVVLGCTTLPVAPAPETEAPVTRMWPASTEPARIQYLGAIDGSGGFGSRKSAASRLGSWIFGVSDEKMVRPMGVAVTKKQLFVADPGAQALFMVSRDTWETRKVTGRDGQPFVSPVGVAAAESGEVYVSDSYLRQIFVFSAGGEFVRTITSEVLLRPAAVLFNDASRRLYVVDAAAHKVHVFDPDGALLSSIGQRGTAPGTFNGPCHVAMGKSGHLYVVDGLNFRLQEFDAEGRFVSMFGRHGDSSGDFARPKGVALDSEGHIYVVDALFDAVQIFQADGQLLLAFGENGGGPGQFWLPTGIAIDEQDRVYVADSYNRRVQVFQYLGESYHGGLEGPP